MLMYLSQNKQIETGKIARFITAFTGHSIIMRVCKMLVLGARTV